MARTKIKMEQTHIDKAFARRKKINLIISTECPVALALHNAGYAYPSVSKKEIIWGKGKEKEYFIKTPSDIQYLIEKYDMNERFKPCEFYMPCGPDDFPDMEKKQ